MMRDHVVGRTFTCDRAAHGNAQQAGKPSGKSASASADARTRISNISDVPTPRFTFGKTYKSAKKTLQNTCSKLATAALSLALALTCVPAAGVAYAAETDDTEAAEAAETAEAANAVEANGEAANDLASGTGTAASASGTGADASDGTSYTTDTAAAPIIANEETHRAYFLASTLQNTTVPIVQATVALTPTEDAAQENATEATGDESALVISLVTGSFVYDGMTFAVTGQNEVTLAAIDTTHLAQDVVENHTLVLPSKLSPNKNELYTLTSISSQVFGEKRVARPQAVAGNSGTANATDVADAADAGVGTESASSGSSEEGAEDSDDPDPDSGTSDNADSANNAAVPRTEAVTAGSGAFIAEDVVLSERAVGDASTDEVPAIATIAVDAQLMTEAELTASTSSQYITALGIPATVTDVAADAFKNYEPLEYLVVAEGNTAYSTYDGALYNADQTSLLLIPEGRQGAVRVAVTATSVPAEMFSHHSGMALIVDAGSAAITSENGFLYDVHLATFDFPVPIAVVDGDEVVACTASFTAADEQAAFDASVYDEAPILEALAAAPQVIWLWGNEADEITADKASSAEHATYDEKVMLYSENATEVDMAESLSSGAVDVAINGGALPCTWTDADGKEHEITAEEVAQGRGDASRAGWSFDPGTGKLSIWSATGTTVSTLWVDTSGEWNASLEQNRLAVRTQYWGPLRSRIVAVDTTQLSGAAGMGYWFAGCTSLSDISLLRIPDGSRGGSVPGSLYSMLLGSVITELPPTFYLPDGVTSLHVTFAGCYRLETIYEGFALPPTLVQGGFEGCTALKYVPSTLFSRLNEKSALSAKYMFAKCTSLTTLGDGFCIPEQVTSVLKMFMGCDSLAYIPNTLDMRSLGDKSVYSMFTDHNDSVSETAHKLYSPLKPTYFAGTADQLAQLLPDVKKNLPSGVTAAMVNTPEKYWELVYGRKLVLLNPDDQDDDNVLAFVEKKLDDGAIGWDVLPPQKKVDGKIDLPDTQNYYGYLLRWYADALRNTPVTVENGKLLVGDTNKVYGMLTPIISMDMPIPGGEGNRNKVDLIINRANNSVEVAGTQDGKAPIKIQSFTPVATKLSVSTRQNMDQLNLSDVLFDGRPTAVSLVIAIKDGETYKLRLSGSAFANIAQIAKATSEEDPGVVDGTLTLEIPATMDIADWDDQVDSVELTTVTWTVAI